jgi:hypothetical protein
MRDPGRVRHLRLAPLDVLVTEQPAPAAREHRHDMQEQLIQPSGPDGLVVGVAGPPFDMPSGLVLPDYREPAERLMHV